MGFNEKGEIIRKSGPQREAKTESQTQTEPQRPAPSKFDILSILKLIALGISGVAEWIIGMVVFALIVIFLSIFFSDISAKQFVDFFISRFILLIYLPIGAICLVFNELKESLEKNKWSRSLLIWVALSYTIFFALVFWFLSQEFNSFVAFFLTPLIAYILYMIGVWRKMEE